MTPTIRALAGRTAVLVGADDIGAGIARRLAREGAAVAVLDPNLSQAERLASDLGTAERPLVSRISYSDLASVARAIEAAGKHLSRIDILITNAMPDAGPAPLERQSELQFAEALERVAGVFRAMQSVFPLMQASGAGRIIHVGHRYGEGINEGIAAYNCAAWSLVGLTRTAAMDWGRYGITTNLLLPLADTGEFRSAQARRPELMRLLVSQVPLGRMGDVVEDVGGAALYLASDDAAFINGQVVYADGGQHTAGPVLNPSRFV